MTLRRRGDELKKTMSFGMVVFVTFWVAFGVTWIALSIYNLVRALGF